MEYSHLIERNVSTPVTVDDVGAGLVPLGLEVFDLRVGVGPQVLVAGPEEIFGRHQHLVHQNTAVVLAAVDFLDEVSEEAVSILNTHTATYTARHWAIKNIH